MRWTPIALSSLFALGGCTFIDDFDFDIADGAVPTDDAGAPEDGGAPTDGATADGAPPPDGGRPEACEDPCLSDATDDFGASQGSGPLEWRYLNDTRSPTGLTYGELAPSTHLGAPAWTDATPPPAIVDCRESTEGACATANAELVLEANAAGGGSDPVLSFTAPAAGSYAVVVDLLAVDGGPAEVLISRTSRLDTVAVGQLSGPGSVTGVLDLLDGERGLITIAPAADPGGEVSVGASVRVSRAPGEALADCQLVAPFGAEAPFDLGCVPGALTEEAGSEDSTEAAGPSAAHGRGRAFRYNARGLRAGGVSLDYSGDFTIQLWMLVDNLNLSQPVVYLDGTASTVETAGGVSLRLLRESEGEGSPDTAVASYRFGTTGAPPVDDSISCTGEGVCTGTIEALLPPFDEWHFYRIVRRADLNEVRLCIDGELVGTGFLDNDVDISPRRDLELGGDGEGTGNALEGSIDDVRVFSRALPCGD